MLERELQRLRQAAGLTVPDVFLKTRIPISTMYHYEREDSGVSPSVGRLKTLLDLYGASDAERLGCYESLAQMSNQAIRLDAPSGATDELPTS